MTIERTNPDTGVHEQSDTFFGFPTGWTPVQK